MSDIFGTINGVTANLGDPTNCDPDYQDGSRQLFNEAKAEKASFGRFGWAYCRTHGGPKMNAYLDAIEQLSNSTTIFGHWPDIPNTFDE